jgi:uncharacterized protein (DUF924 family)
MKLMNPEVQQEILEFWLGDSEPDFEEMDRRITLWFEAAPEIDVDIASRFEAVFRAARNGELDGWKTTARGSLALIILLDQFSRNLHRGSERAFMSDAEALRICLEGVELGLDTELSIVERAFFYMPMQHAEKMSAQDQSVRMFEALASSCSDAIRPQMQRFLASARSHRTIVEKFGRFPHRNRVLGRQCTDAEREFLTVGTVPFRKKA